ncbi:zf-CHY-domain-containing protein [Patellaria atrata CBS 101060]|uniref:Zf-CHY-domain-containing protein n=1 Tax=Patellaria atrata CBS 101060 TaxID=1346257 RepID=A0A9P4SDV5_9PEZI|nr:zf-CHY-domain-containing protein [Patellaria atrata CBS 101060]
MTNLISSLIQPVVRQARRLSTTTATSDSEDGDSLSHAHAVTTTTALPSDPRATDEGVIERQPPPSALADDLFPTQSLSSRPNPPSDQLPSADVVATEASLSSSAPAPDPMSETLPADDGMRSLRERIHAIRELPISNDEKAKRMHQLMMEDYVPTKSHVLRPVSPSSIKSSDTPITPSSSISITDLELQRSSPSAIYDPSSLMLQMTVEEKQPHFRPRPLATQSANSSEQVQEYVPELGCEHYKRNVKMQCFDCKRWYTCRICHNQAEDHEVRRRKTQNMYCMLCSTPQPVGDMCRNCGVSPGWYYCDICHLWEDDALRRIYHCNDCGICRIGEGLGRDFNHCKKCNVCISISYYANHRCIERATECDCPICGDYMFTSNTSVVAMPCGHYIHKECYNQYMETAYKCPICKKSVVNMDVQWRKIDHAIETQPMPPQFDDTRVVVHCNDCEAKSEGKYHWLGNKCGTCDSYNTSEIRMFGRTEDIAILAQQRHRRLSNVAAAGTIPSTRSSPLPLHSPTDLDENTPVASNIPSPARIQFQPTLAPHARTDSLRRASGSYFLAADAEANSDRPASSSSGQGFLGNSRASALEMFHRVSRSLSPGLSSYLNGRHFGVFEGDTEIDGDEEMTDADGEESEVDFWGADGRFLSGEEEAGDMDGGDSGEEDSDDSMDDVDDEVEVEEGEDDEEDLLELLGHR